MQRCMAESREGTPYFSRLQLALPSLTLLPEIFFSRRIQDSTPAHEALHTLAVCN